MSIPEYNTAHGYILCNTPEVQPFLQDYHRFLDELDPEQPEEERNRDVTKNFATWFFTLVRSPDMVVPATAALLRTLSLGPTLEIKRYKGYYINGYYFDIRQGDGNKSTFNSGVCVKGSCYEDGDNDVDYYGVIEEIWELSYGLMYDKVVLFKCFWYDTRRWMRVHPRNGMVEIKHKSRASKDDPFILASQAQQVYYLRYVSSSREHQQWRVAMKSKARSHVDWTHMQNVDVTALQTGDIFQEEQQPPPVVGDPTPDLNIVEDGVFIMLQEDDAGVEYNDGSDYESDYPDDDDSDVEPENYFGTSASSEDN